MAEVHLIVLVPDPSKKCPNLKLSACHFIKTPYLRALRATLEHQYSPTKKSVPAMQSVTCTISELVPAGRCEVLFANRGERGGGHNISMFPLGEALIIFTICEGGL